MLNVYLDTAALLQLSRGQYPEALAELKRLKSQRKLAVYFTLHNLHELLCTVGGGEELSHCRDLLTFSSGLCSEYILEDNWERMRRAVASFWGMTLPKLTIDWAKMTSLVSERGAHQELEDRIDFLRNYLDGFKQDWLQQARALRSQMRQLPDLDRLTTTGESRPGLATRELSFEALKQQLWEACKIHHRLPSYAGRLEPEAAYQKIPPVRYFIDIQTRYFESMLRQGTTPAEADYFDIGYVIYLDVLDYFVTADRVLKSLFDSASEEIGQACILLDDIGGLELLPPRAPYRERFEERLLALESR